jgi:hypothetical protein
VLIIPNIELDTSIVLLAGYIHCTRAFALPSYLIATNPQPKTKCKEVKTSNIVPFNVRYVYKKFKVMKYMFLGCPKTKNAITFCLNPSTYR